MRTQRLYVLWIIGVVLSISAAVSAEQEKKDAKLSFEQKLELVKSVSKSLVKVEYTFKVDKGEEPSVGGWSRYCPNCGEYHTIAYGGELIKDERPLEAAGYVIGDKLILANDLMAHPRFVESIKVRFAGNVVDAKIKSYGRNNSAAVLELAESLEGIKTPAFDKDQKGPLVVVSYDKLNATWSNTVTELGSKMTIDELGRTFRSASASGFALNKDGTVVGVCADNELPVDDSWKGSPLDWDWIDADQMDKLLDKTEKIANGGILRTMLNLRSPKKNSGRSMYYMDGGDGENKTEINTLSLLLDSKRAMVLTNMKAGVTARLERITIYTDSGQAVNAKFAGTLSDYGAFIVDLEKEIDGAIEFSSRDILKYRKTLLPLATIKVQGKKRISYFCHKRIPGFTTGWHGQVYPQISGGEEGVFLFDDQGKLVAFPIAKREEVEDEDSWYYDRDKAVTSVAYLSRIIGDIANNIDSSNVPLSEAEENRIAWMGIELQAMDRELAQINNVSEQTDNGRTGGLVSYVYEGSPAAKAGIEPGTVLLRLYSEVRSKPIEINVSDDSYFMDNFPWDQLDQIPAAYFDQIPQPWPGAENSFTKVVTSIGFGKKYTAEFSLDGKLFKKDFVVEEGPAHYGSAKRHKSESLGITVRDLTYEVRRYFQKLPDDPGVIVSKVEPGEKAAVSGIKPFEIVTRINDQPVLNVADFERLITDQTELRISLKRKAKGRVVKIRMSDAKAKDDASTE